MKIARPVPGRRGGVAVAFLVVAVAGLGPVVVARATAVDAGPCDRAAAVATERRQHDVGSGRQVVVIGDSYSVGAGVASGQSWPVRLPGRVHVDGFSGSGFSADASPCGAVSYADRAARAVAGRPGALVVVEGGLNDHDRSDAEIGAGFLALLPELAGHDVLVVGPSRAPHEPMAAEVDRVDRTLAALSLGFGVRYLSMLDVDLDYLDDEIHPTADGHRRFGDAVAAEVREMARRAATS